MNHSPVMDEFWQHDLPQPIAGLRQRHHELRNLHQDIIKQVQHQLQVGQYCLPVARPAVRNHPSPTCSLTWPTSLVPAPPQAPEAGGLRARVVHPGPPQGLHHAQ